MSARGQARITRRMRLIHGTHGNHGTHVMVNEELRPYGAVRIGNKMGVPCLRPVEVQETRLRIK